MHIYKDNQFVFTLVSDKKGTPQKRKRGSVQLDNSPITGSGVTPRTPGSNQRPIPLSERQQMALLMKMTDESSQGGKHKYSHAF